MSQTDYRAVALRLLDYWHGEEPDSLWCRALAERLEKVLSVSERSSVEGAPDPELVERKLSALAAVDPVVRDLIRKVSPPAAERPAPPMTGESRSAASVSPPVPEPMPMTPRPGVGEGGEQTVIHAENSSGMVVGRDASIHGGLHFGRPSPPSPAARQEEAAAAKVAENAIRILFLGANPKDTTPLGLDQEVRQIGIALAQAEFRDSFDFRQQWAVRVTDLQRALLQHRPQILHFSGHGSRANALCLEDESGQTRELQKEALARLLAVFRQKIRCVVLNACYSKGQAQAIAENIDCVVGMSRAIGDAAAISFSTSFYQALAFGSDVQTAFELGCVQIQMEELGEEDTPQLLALRCDPSTIVFANSLP